MTLSLISMGRCDEMLDNYWVVGSVNAKVEGSIPFTGTILFSVRIYAA